MLDPGYLAPAYMRHCVRVFRQNKPVITDGGGSTFFLRGFVNEDNHDALHCTASFSGMRDSTRDRVHPHCGGLRVAMLSRRTREAYLTHQVMALVPFLCVTLVVGFVFAAAEVLLAGHAVRLNAMPIVRAGEDEPLQWLWVGYHGGLMLLVAGFFHLPMLYLRRWSWREEAEVAANIVLFLIWEDFLRLMLHPAYGFARFSATSDPAARRWFWGMPVAYYAALVVVAALLWLAVRDRRTTFQMPFFWK